MMNVSNKGFSPFVPGRPAPPELFTGRRAEIEHIRRAIRETEAGRQPQAIFLTGEYGIGKSSLASFSRHVAERNHQLLGIHVYLGGLKTVEELAVKTVETVLREETFERTLTDKIRDALGKYVEQADIFGVSINLQALITDAPNLRNGFLAFLKNLYTKSHQHGIKGLVLILDEINGISSSPDFAHFIKSLVDENATSRQPLPLLLMLCGVEERRKEMIQHHRPIERIFDIVEIKPMEDAEMHEFFKHAFAEANAVVESEALKVICHFSQGFPKVMHIIGDAVFYSDDDGIVDREDAILGVLKAALNIGKTFVDQQVYKALRSADYHAILKKLAEMNFDLSFQRQELEQRLTNSEKAKFANFLQRLKRLKVLRSGDLEGEWTFTNRMVRTYIRFSEVENSKAGKS